MRSSIKTSNRSRIDPGFPEKYNHNKRGRESPRSATTFHILEPGSGLQEVCRYRTAGQPVPVGNPTSIVRKLSTLLVSFSFMLSHLCVHFTSAFCSVYTKKLEDHCYFLTLLSVLPRSSKRFLSRNEALSQFSTSLFRSGTSLRGIVAGESRRSLTHNKSQFTKNININYRIGSSHDI